MRITAANITRAVALLEAEFSKLRDISGMEDAEELHGEPGLSDDEAQAFDALETMLREAKTITDLL